MFFCKLSKEDVFQVGDSCLHLISGEACSFKGTSRLELMKNEIEHNAFSYSRSGPNNLWPSISNYVLQISSSDSQVPVAFMYFFDSGGGSYPEILSTAQAEWFRVKSQQINPDARLEKHYSKCSAFKWTLLTPQMSVD